ncbi:ABC transporter permease [Bifidobacterium ramosum]|uniref:ABC transporter permease n=1 Tax=Bifidobacterium ramosum TaxID=1798158 RepID=A0A6L4X1C9_9BIFI|nr:ABC transporter permease [Bifidobacterium ramosum]KAB8288777.1 ABC transporter permease [Bifidobacterium ramosum]NEG71360.1 ABC transporter permease [Bifidobacterium ramosum]
MTAALTLVRMRWALTWATLRKSVWQTVGYAIALVFAVGTVIGVAALAWLVGTLPPFVPPEAPGLPPVNLLGPHGVINTVVVLFGAFLTLAVGLFQIMLLGEGSTMSPRKFALYGIPDRELQFGLLLSGLTGIPAITGVLSLLCWSLAYRAMGPAVVVTAVVAAPLAVVTMMSVSKMLLSLSTTLVTSRRGQGVFYIIVVLLFVGVMQVPNILVNSGVAEGLDVAGIALIAAAVAWTPFGAAFQLPYDALLGDWPALLARVAILAVAWMLCFMVCTWCLRRERLVAGKSSEAVKAKGIGAFGWMPDSPSGAVSARLLTYLRRDPRQLMMFIMPVFFIIIFSLQAHGESGMVWQSLIWAGWIFAIAESNGLAYDGRGFTMQVIAGVSGFTDRIGRVRVYAAIIVAYELLMFVAVAIITGDWTRPGGLLFGATFAAVGIGMGLSGLGLAEITSCVLMYPVASMDKPFSSPQGRMVAQGFFPLAYLIGSFVAMLPTGIVTIVMIAVFPIEFGMIYWLLIPVALANGAGALALGSWLGGKLLDARMLSVVRTLDSFASLQQ